jgi:DNA-3-methyladenine glycosylase II
MTPFECAAWAVLSQRYPSAAALRVKQALQDKYGSNINVQGRKRAAFPEPNQIANRDSKEIASIVKNDRRASFLISVAKAFYEMDEHFLRTAKYDQVEDKLRSIEGIGDWSSRLIMIRGLGRMEKLAIESRLLRAASKVYGKGREVTEPVLEQLSEKYGPWKGYWAYYLRTNALSTQV